MAILKNFVIKNGLQVNENLIFADLNSEKVGVNTTAPEYSLDVRGGIGVTDINIAGVSTALSDFLVGTGATAFAIRVGSANSVGIGTSLPDYPLQIVGSVSTGQTSLDVYGDSAISGNLNVGGALSVTGNSYFVGMVTFAAGADGNITIGDTTTDNVIFNANIDSSIIPDDDDTFDLGSASQQWKDLYVNGTAYIDDLSADDIQFTNLTENRIPVVGAGSSIEDDANLTFDGSILAVGAALTVTGAGRFNSYVEFTSSDYIKIPVGDTAQRPAGAGQTVGQIRYNTELSTFEGFGAGDAWGSLGGVKDVDQDTYIIPELSANSDEDTLFFYTAGAEKLRITPTGNVGIGTTNAAGAADTNNTAILNVGVVTANYLYGDGRDIHIGAPSDGSLTESGAINTLTEDSTLVNTLDDLNEVAFNIIKNTAVTGVSLTTTDKDDGDPHSTSLRILSIGNANEYTIDWDDGTIETLSGTQDDQTYNHTYNTAGLGGAFTPTVTAKNNTGVGAGHSFTVTADWNYIVYTPNPVVDFELYRASSGGVALSGEEMWVIEGDSLYLDNNTSDCNTPAMNAEFSIDWGDGTSTETGITTTDPGGSSPSASRLQHTWTTSPVTQSGTGRDDIVLTVTRNDLAAPAVIAAGPDLTKLLKVYNDNPADPANLTTKTLQSISGQTANTPRLASGFSDNSGNLHGLTKGDAAARITNASGTVTTTWSGSSYAFSANAGTTLTAVVNGSADGSRLFDGTGSDQATFTSLVVTDTDDYKLLDANGNATSFANSIHFPTFARGFRATVSKSAAIITTGANTMQLSHSDPGNETNTVSFVKDALVSVPTTDNTIATLTEGNSGTFRYISGIPYYNTGSPTLTLSGTTVTNLVGQFYIGSATDIVQVANSSALESSSGSAASTNNYSYAQIDSTPTIMDGVYPLAETISAYSIDDLTINLNTNTRSVNKLRVRSRNVNGNGSYTSDLSPIVQVHSASQSNISEISIAVDDALGDGFDDDGVRIYDFKDETTDTPSYNGATNFYTNQPYTESLTSATVGAKEAIVRIGNIKFDQTDFSTGHLPAGPDRSAAPSTQYFTFAFRRTPLANFNINITSSGIAGLWIAAPGSSIDTTSSLNGWLRADTQYNGSGVPGSGPGGNGSDGCAVTGLDRIQPSTSLSGNYEMTLGSENLNNSTGNVALIRIALTSGQSITSLSVS